ncbi:MAG TPA: Mov34/MPN/PAD-1 family protein [Polyangiaceae bacterium]
MSELYESHVSQEVFAPVVGRYSDDGATAICSAILAHHPGQRFEVAIDDREAAGIGRSLAELWDSTGGEIYYLGDWHTHPGGISRYSAIDKTTALARAADAAAKAPQFIMLISGTDGLSCSIATREGDFMELHRLRGGFK